jgi:hypothetical protein
LAFFTDTLFAELLPSDAVAPYSEPGGYINVMDDDDNGRVRDNYGVNYDRRVELKRRYDPDNFFRINQNIAP